MMTLDDLSGLPVLPEGQFWRVRHPYGSAGSALNIYGIWEQKQGYDKTRLQVAVVKRWEDVCQRRVDETPVQRFVRSFFGREHVLQETRVERECVLFDEPCQGTHPQAVLDAANRIMKRVRKQEATSALLGDYPPKRLEVS